MSGGGGMGYDIPVSLSMASTTTSSVSQNNETVFNFAPYDTGGSPYNLSAPDAPATAVASTAQGGNSSAAAAGTGVGTQGGAASPTSSVTSLFSSPVALIGLALVGYLVYKHMKGGA